MYNYSHLGIPIRREDKISDIRVRKRIVEFFADAPGTQGGVKHFYRRTGGPIGINEALRLIKADMDYYLDKGWIEVSGAPFAQGERVIVRDFLAYTGKTGTVEFTLDPVSQTVGVEMDNDPGIAVQIPVEHLIRLPVVPAQTEREKVLACVLRQILLDLPTKRDWLDPQLEDQARDLIKLPRIRMAA